MCRNLDLSNCIQLSDDTLAALASYMKQAEAEAEEDALAWEALQVRDASQPRLVGKARLHVEARHCGTSKALQAIYN